MRSLLLAVTSGLAFVLGCAGEGADTSSSAESNIDSASLTPTKIAWATSLHAAIEAIDLNTAIAPSAGVDRTALYSQLETELFAGPETPATLVRALRKAELAYPSGHLGFSLEGNTCWASVDIGLASYSRIAACAQPFEDHAVVSMAPEGGLLRAGDEILAVNGKRGDEMMQVALEQPMCTSSSASASNRRFRAATSLFSLAKPGMTIEVRHLDGAIEVKTVAPADIRPSHACRDAFGADTSYVARSSRRGDIGIIRVPNLNSPQKAGETPEQAQARLHAELVAAFEEVKDARAIVWDLRNNGGGTTPFGLEIVAGFPGAKANAAVGSYRMRRAGTPTFYPIYTYRLPEPGAFAYHGKVAVLIDGLTISAADYTARAARLASDAIVLGSPTAGAYGGGGQSTTVGASPAVVLRTDPYLGVEEDGETIIEGKSAEPTIPVELQPADLARGVDTVLEAAIAALR